MSKVYLRALELQDHETILSWRNDRRITNLLGGNTFWVSKEREKKWVENAATNDRVNLHLGIVSTSDNLLIGLVNLTSIDYINKKAEFSIMIGNVMQQGKGIGFETVTLMLNHAFMELNMNKVFLSVLTKNEKAINLYRKCGFKHEGLLRQEVYKNGEYNDMIIMSILKDEFKQGL